MIGVDPTYPATHAAFHRGQGHDQVEPPLCIAKGEYQDLRHFYNDCPNIASEESYYAFWQN